MALANRKTKNPTREAGARQWTDVVNATILEYDRYRGLSVVSEGGAPMPKTSLALALIWMLAGISAEAKDSLPYLPGPVASYAEQFDKECQSSGLGHVVVNEHYSADNPGPKDVNGDGVPDYVIYKCMFGCSEKPFAFVGIGTPCPWGSLLLSQGGHYATLFLPGRVSRVQSGSPVRISLQRPRELRASGNYCKEPFPDSDPVYIYELKKERFQLVGSCPSGGSCEFPSEAGL